MSRKSKKLKNKLIIGFSILVAFLIVMLTFNRVPDVITSENIKEGIHYNEISKDNKDLYKSDKKIIAIVSMTCPHCYDFAKTFRYMQKDIEFVPVGWGRGFEQLSKVMLTAKKFSNNNKVIYELFELYKNPNVSVNQAFRIIQENTKATLQEIQEYYASPTLAALIKTNQKNANQLPVTGVPTILVGSKKLKIENIKGNDNFKVLMNELTK